MNWNSSWGGFLRKSHRKKVRIVKYTGIWDKYPSSNLYWCRLVQIKGGALDGGYFPESPQASPRNRKVSYNVKGYIKKMPLVQRSLCSWINSNYLVSTKSRSRTKTAVRIQWPTLNKINFTHFFPCYWWKNWRYFFWFSTLFLHTPKVYLV